jgi:lactate dehydrogenase-like 2-hydroxyacid dehydrogenase
MCGMSLVNSVVGIIGFGKLGVCVASILKGISVAKIIYADPVEYKFGKSTINTIINIISLVCTSVSLSQSETALLRCKSCLSLLPFIHTILS